MTGLLVQAYKYNGAKHYSYPVEMITQTPELITVYGAVGRLLNHPGRALVDLPLPTETVEFHFTNRPYNVFAAWQSDGSFRNYYCNLITPTRLADGVISAVDLDLDLNVRPDLTYQIEDEDEFEEHRAAWGYPDELVQMARQGLLELIDMVERRRFPFDGSAARIREAYTRQRR